MEKKKKKRNFLFTRLNLLFFLVFLLFSLLIVRIGVLQIVKGEEYKREVEATENVTVKNSVPRGRMYDRYGRVVVDNDPLYMIVYTKTKTNTTEDRLALARKLAKYVDVDLESLKERDLKDYWIMMNKKDEQAYKKKLSKKERDTLSESEKYKLVIKRITEKDLQSITPEERKVAGLYVEIEKGYSLGSQVVKRGLTFEEVAAVSEHLEELPGIDIQMDSNRKYPYGDSFRAFFGNMKEIPKEQRSYYEARDYSLNDKVGQSYIEQYYEPILSGKKGEEVYSKQGTLANGVKKTSGQRGRDLVLTIDMDLQQQVEKALKELGIREGYVVMMNPKTGEVLSLAGIKDNEDASIGTIYNSFEMGSTVKGATVLTGYQTGAIHPGEQLVDTPLKFAGTPEKKSWKTFGPVSDLKALEVSSNVYMFRVAMKVAGVEYRPNGSLKIPEEAFTTMRKYFNQFGLGVKTGIDLPNEAVGYRSDYDPKSPGLLLDFAIGQFDTYTPMQLAQYVSTIANGGYRMKPELVKEIREPAQQADEADRVIFDYSPTVLNRVDMPEDQIKRVQQGFYNVYHGSQGTARAFASKPYAAAGKTGTAETFKNGRKTQNLTLIGYAPYDDPQVAFSIVLPYIGDGHKNIELGMKILDSYFELQKARESAQGVPAQSNQEPVIAK